MEEEMSRQKSVYLIVVIFLILSLMTSCAPPAGKSTGGGGTLIVGRGGDSVMLDGAAVTDGESWRVIGEIVDTLTRLEGTSTKVIPWLAESWSTTDSKTWQFKIRKGVKFHDGTPVNAEAVKWNFDRWRDPNNQWRYGRTFEYYQSEFEGAGFGVVDTKVVDEYTFEVTLANPTAVLLYKLPLSSFGIASPTAIQKEGDKYGTPAGTAVGSGPFMFKEWVPDDHITLVRNPNWWGDGPKLDSLIFRSIPDNSARLAELLAGTIHQADLAQTDMPTAEADPNIKNYTLPVLSTGYIAFQQCMEPFDDVKVRWAVAHAINREALIKNFYTKQDTLAKGFMPPAVLGSNPKLPAIEYNPDKAKQLLTEAGFPDGFSTEFWYIPVIRGYFPDSKAIAEAIAVDLAKVGIKVELKTEDWGAYLEDRNVGKFSMWMLGWGSDNGDPDNYIGWHFSHPVGEPRQEDCYANDKLAQLLIDGAKAPEIAKREKIYQEAEQIVHDDMPRIPVSWVAGRAFFRSNVEGYVPVVFRSWYEKLSIAK
jgi:peptide/nickel transport system substrate-binding protein